MEYEYIILHDLQNQDKEIKVFVHNIFAVEENMIFGPFPDNILFTVEDHDEIMAKISGIRHIKETESDGDS